MAHEDLARLLHDLSVDMALRGRFNDDREKVMTDAGLSDDEKALVRDNDIVGINRYFLDYVQP